jgi:hypothetical protein
MIDLPANITWPVNDDGWSVEQHGECIESVQAFREGMLLIVELWGKTTAISPAGKRYTDVVFQQNIDIDLATLAWTGKRWLKGITDEAWRLDPAVRFEMGGRADDIVQYRRI